jgi:hypothetical protein
MKKTSKKTYSIYSYDVLLLIAVFCLAFLLTSVIPASGSPSLCITGQLLMAFKTDVLNPGFQTPVCLLLLVSSIYTILL